MFRQENLRLQCLMICKMTSKLRNQRKRSEGVVRRVMQLEWRVRVMQWEGLLSWPHQRPDEWPVTKPGGHTEDNQQLKSVIKIHIKTNISTLYFYAAHCYSQLLIYTRESDPYAQLLMQYTRPLFAQIFDYSLLSQVTTNIHPSICLYPSLSVNISLFISVCLPLFCLCARWLEMQVGLSTCVSGSPIWIGSYVDHFLFNS